MLTEPRWAAAQIAQHHPRWRLPNFEWGDDVKVSIDSGRCQGHGRCYDLAPEMFADDEEGYGVVRGDGVVPVDEAGPARLAALNCPESAIGLIGEAS